MEWLIISSMYICTALLLFGMHELHKDIKNEKEKKESKKDSHLF